MPATTRLQLLQILVLLVVIVAGAVAGENEAAMAVEEQEDEDPPCANVNPLCTCSNPGPHDLGRVTCVRVPLEMMPDLSSHRIFMLRMEYNGMRVWAADETPLANTGLFRLSIRHNIVTKISSRAFKGIERSLRELNLGHNRLHNFPRNATKNLLRLQKLNLEDNCILQLQVEDLANFQETLEDLNLRNNLFVQLPTNVFARLRRLRTLDLSGNRLTYSLDKVFSGGPSLLRHLNLEDNHLVSIPFGAITSLEGLQVLDVSKNIIRSIDDFDDHGVIPSTHRGTVNLERLHLEYNRIDKLPFNSFRFFAAIGKLFLDYNPIDTIYDGAFWSTKLQEVSLRGCNIKQLSPNLFKGVESALMALDLSFNTLSADVVARSMSNLTTLQRLMLTGTNIGLLPVGTFANVRHSVQHLQLDSSGKWENTGGAVRLSELQKLKNIRVLAMAQFPTISLSGLEFRGQSSTIETLSLRGSNLRALESDAFRFVAGLRTLDASYNHLDSVHYNAFQTIGHSLETLDLTEAFVPSLTTLPHKLFNPLVAVRYLNLANNCLKYLPVQTFTTNFNLRTLNLMDNCLVEIRAGTFSGERQTNLRIVNLSFNRLERVDSWSFVDLDRLRQIDLSDNRITVIGKNTFVGLSQLQHLNLRGNRISTIDYEAMQNLPVLRKLDLAYNALSSFDFNLLEQLGAMATLHVNISHNHLSRLAVSSNNHTNNVNIKVLDLSFNGVTVMEDNYFHSITSSLMQLLLGHNQLQNITRYSFGRMTRLQTLYLGNNRLMNVDEDAFMYTNQLQLLSLVHNQLSALPSALFRNCPLLRRLDVSRNHIKELSDLLFSGVSALEYLNLSFNRLGTFPLEALKLAASTIGNLNLSNNFLGHSKKVNLETFKKLYNVDLSSNGDDGVPGPLSTVQVLRLGGNQLKELKAIESSVTEEIYLRDVDLHRLPDFDTPNLLSLDISRNRVLDLSAADVFHNCSDVRWLDISDNLLQTFPPHIGANLPHLVYLNLAYNPLHHILNNSFFNFRLLNSLELHETSMKVTLGHLKSLRSLSITHHSSSDTVRTVSELDGVRRLTLYIKRHLPFALKSNANQYLPAKLRTVVLNGMRLSHLAIDAFQAFVNTNLTLRLHHTSVTRLQRNVFSSYIRTLRLDLTNNNLMAVEDMVSSEQPGAQGLFLVDMALRDNPWKCDDCDDVGWVEGWMRRRRQRVCLHGLMNSPCLEAADQMRDVQCNHHKQLLEVLKDDLECEWKSTGHVHTLSMPLYILIGLLWFLL